MQRLGAAQTWGPVPFAGAPHKLKEDGRWKIFKGHRRNVPKDLRFSMDINSDVPGCLVGKKGVWVRGEGWTGGCEKATIWVEVFWREKRLGGVVKGFCSWWPAAQRLGRRLCARRLESWAGVTDDERTKMRVR